MTNCCFLYSFEAHENRWHNRKFYLISTFTINKFIKVRRTIVHVVFYKQPPHDFIKDYTLVNDLRFFNWIGWAGCSMKIQRSLINSWWDEVSSFTILKYTSKQNYDNLTYLYIKPISTSLFPSVSTSLIVKRDVFKILSNI